jgi:hypothetical protein
MMAAYPSEGEVARIAAMADAAARNREITGAYCQLSAEAERRIAGRANWCTFATWASRQAGVTIRHEDLTDALRARLGHSWRLRFIEKPLIRLLERDGLDVLQAVIDAVSTAGPLLRSAEAVGRGNRKVFAEIGLLFARWLGQFPDPASASDEEAEAFYRGLLPGGPPDGQGLLRSAFANYRAAARESGPKSKAELMLLANLQIGYHEQKRLQPEIEAAMNGAVFEPRDLVDLLLPILRQRARRLPHLGKAGEMPLKAVAGLLARHVQTEVRALLTEHLMTLFLPPALTLRLGRDLTRPFPEALRTLTNASLAAMIAGFDTAPDSEAGGGATDWANFEQRIRFIADLFRAFADDRNLFSAPFAGEERER